jgi:phosphoribosylaminoimidazole-succinocarboxamide synthase
MEMEKYEVRVLLRHYWKQNYKAAAAAAEKKSDVEGKGAVNEHTAQRWFKWFVSGNLSLEYEQHPG